MHRRLGQFGPLTPAERAVIARLGTGNFTVLGDGTLPGESAGEDRRVRASLIRWLALGAPGDDSVRLHEKGLRIAGALVVSDGKGDSALDLEGCTLAHDLALVYCRFQHPPLLRGARVQSLFLNRAALPGLEADGLEARGVVFLRAVRATGEVRLLRAWVGSDLSCTNGRFENAGGTAVNADGLEARGGVFLRDVHTTGEVRLLGARIGGNLECEGGRFENAGGTPVNAVGLEARGDVFLRDVHATGEVRLLGAQVGGNLECDGGQFENAGGRALDAAGARVAGTLFWRNGSHATGAINLTAAEIRDINDDAACWPGPGDLLLNRCRYGAFTGMGVSGGDRIRWLDPESVTHH